MLLIPKVSILSEQIHFLLMLTLWVYMQLFNLKNLF